MLNHLRDLGFFDDFLENFAFSLKIVDTAANDSYLFIGRGIILVCWCLKFVTRRILGVALSSYRHRFGEYVTPQ